MPQVESIASLVCELAREFFTWTQFAELEPGAEAAHPAGTVRPSAACCHGISTRCYFFNTTQPVHVSICGSYVYFFVMPFVVVFMLRSGRETDLVTGRGVLAAGM